jgi:hypothetical protein
MLQNDGTGQLDVAFSVPVGEQPHQVVSGDFNGDGLPDLATANDAEASITILLNGRS